ncbi:glycosyltransferase [Ramlibacter sp.]|uniref:glycosyltransferase n=1 Tax=Ramlibacter sp. TaxID=1917967 RepID=UPI002C967F62|nr:glycosyltransferase [Ramlibacter sp.]HWI80666.1 glycosyltransferase [Ramlibacter sp.]
MNTEAAPRAPVREAPPAPQPPARRQRIAIFAPHLATPIRNGGDLYIWRKWGSLDPHRHAARLFAADGVYELAPAGWTRLGEQDSSSMRGKAAAAAHAVLAGGDYLSSRFDTPAYLARVRANLAGSPDLAVYSLPSTWLHVAPLVQGAGASLVETHNYEPKFYLDRAAEGRGPFRMAAGMAAVRAHALLARLPKDLPLVALGAADAEIFRALGHRTVLLSGLGYELEPPRARFPDAGTVRIAFVAALSITMNVAAIRNFADHGLPALRAALGPSLAVHVAGSRPGPALVARLRRGGIEVHADPTDAQLADLLDGCHATILPFESSNGLKLKFATAAARGIPILSYIQPPPELAGAAAVLTSQDMAQWAAFLRRLAQPGALAQAARELQGIVSGRTWRACVQGTLAALRLEAA